MRAVDNDTFIKVWQSSKTKSEAVERLGIKSAYASWIAAQLRHAGVDLQKFPRGRQPEVIDAAALNDLAKKAAEHRGKPVRKAKFRNDR